MNILKPGGGAAVMLPDNCLFEDKAGEVFEILMQDCNLHVLSFAARVLFTPYSHGIKANVIFFRKVAPLSKSGFSMRDQMCLVSRKKTGHSARITSQSSSSIRKDLNGLSRRTRNPECYKKVQIGRSVFKR